MKYCLGTIFLEGTRDMGCHRTLTVEEKDHCTAGLQINWIGYDQTRKHVVICSAKTTESQLVKQETSGQSYKALYDRNLRL